MEEETTIELFTNWLFRDNSSYVEQWIYDNRFEVMIQCDALNFFTLDGKKISLKKVAMRGPLKNCGNGSTLKNQKSC